MNSERAQFLSNILPVQVPASMIRANRKRVVGYESHDAKTIRIASRKGLPVKSLDDCRRNMLQPTVRRAAEKRIPETNVARKRKARRSVRGDIFENTFTSLLDENTHNVGLAVISENMTERRRLEIERDKAIQMMLETRASLQQYYHDLMAISMETISNLLEKRDLYTSNHSVNVSRYALKIYEHRFGFGPDYGTLRTAAALHDIGKIAIPDRILNKPEELTVDEYDMIKSHSVIAERILKPLDDGGEISRIVRHHHERYDGLGYPDGLAGKEIPMLSRIITIADAYDAMISDRPYRKALPFEKAVEEIKSYSGKQFDPEWVGVFLELAENGSL